MKNIILFLMVFILVVSVYCDLFKSTYEKSIENLTREDLIDLAIKQNKKYKTIKKDYNILYKHDTKILNAYKQITKRPVILNNIHFSISAGLSGIFNRDNPLRSNLDFLISGSFYYKYMKYNIGYLPINQQIILSIGIFY